MITGLVFSVNGDYPPSEVREISVTFPRSVGECF
jgi:hypothetical protein